MPFIAIVAILALGYIPGFERPSRWLLGLVVLVIVLKNYQTIANGIKNFAATGGQTAQAAGASEQQAAQTAQAQATQAQTAMAQLGSTPNSANAFQALAGNALGGAIAGAALA